jgi:ubiquinone biosynthesis protein
MLRRVAALVRRTITVAIVVTPVVAVVGSTILWDRVVHGGRPRTAERPKRVRQMFEDLGPTFTKLGQLVAGRADLVPARYGAELAKLRDHVTPMATDVALDVLRRAYVEPIEVLFPTISSAPIAAASIGQVYRATIADGRTVAIKIRRPEAASLIEADLAVLDAVAGAVHLLVPPLRRLQLRALVAQFATALREELDYKVEAAHTSAIGASLAGVEWIGVPQVVDALSRSDVLVMEFVDGIPLTDVDRLVREGFDLQQLSNKVVAANLQLILFSDLYQADPHAGNYLVQADGRLMMLDFGQTGHSDPATRAELLMLMSALAAGDAERVAESIEAISGVDSTHDAALGADVADFVAKVSERPVASIKIGGVMHDMMSLLRRHGLPLRPEMTMLVKAVVEFETTAGEMHAELRFGEVVPLAIGLSQRRLPPAPAVA